MIFKVRESLRLCWRNLGAKKQKKNESVQQAIEKKKAEVKTLKKKKMESSSDEDSDSSSDDELKVSFCHLFCSFKIVFTWFNYLYCYS